MEAPTAPCNGYWYNVNLKTPTAGLAYKCITQAEYDVVMTQRAQADQAFGMFAVGIGMLALAFIFCMFAIQFITGKRRRHRDR